jgi:spore germination cell wall hydrolase CwlJ-like protein
VVAAATPVTGVPASTLSGAAWIAQGTVTTPAAPQPAAAPAPVAMAIATGALHVDSLSQLVGDMPIQSDLSADLKCLAQAVYFEARGEPIEGQLAVAEVVINRARSGLYPDNYCDVVTQPAQFSFVRHGQIPAADETSAAWQRAEAIAEIAQQNLWQSKASDALYFHATYVRPSWAHQKVQLAQIDTHIFYR